MNKKILTGGSIFVFMFILTGCVHNKLSVVPQEDVPVADQVVYTVPPSEQKTIDSTLAEEMRTTPVSKDDMMMETKSKYVEGVDFRYSGALADVSGGSASGVAMQDSRFGEYMLHARFSGLPTTSNGDFYEGWIVRRNPFHFISTGRVESVRGVMVNTYLSESNLLDHDFYVLTLEPDDGDPAPAKHILEGVMDVVR
jgi:hypothetical protein